MSTENFDETLKRLLVGGQDAMRRLIKENPEMFRRSADDARRRSDDDRATLIGLHSLMSTEIKRLDTRVRRQALDELRVNICGLLDSEGAQSMGDYGLFVRLEAMVSRCQILCRRSGEIRQRAEDLLTSIESLDIAQRPASDDGEASA